MGIKGARRSTGTTLARRKILSTLDPNTILKLNPDPNTHPNPKPSPTPTLLLIKIEYWDRAGGGGNIRYDW